MSIGASCVAHVALAPTGDSEFPLSVLGEKRAVSEGKEAYFTMKNRAPAFEKLRFSL